MVRTLGSLLGVSKQTEMLAMTVVTLGANIFDMALFELSSNLEQVWKVPLEVSKFTPESQNFMKILLSSVVFVRTFSLHLYIAFLIAMFWPAIFGTRPTLMLPWLTVSAIKNIGAGLVTFTMGIYTCILYGPMRPACLRFFCSQILDLSPSFYMWIVAISLYRDLRKPCPVDKVALKLTEEEELNVALRRRKVKSMVDEDILREQFESRRKFVGTSAVEVKEIFTPSCFEETLNVKISRSLDSLLDAMTAEAEILEAEEFEPLEDGLNLCEKTAKLLGITMSEISRIKQNKQTLDLPLYPVIAQRKQFNVASTANSILASEAPLRLLPETSLYTPSSKAVRSTKSELKSHKDIQKMKSPSDFMATVPESELKFSNYNQESKKPCITETIYANKNISENELDEVDTNEDILKRNHNTFVNQTELKDMDGINKFDSSTEETKFEEKRSEENKTVENVSAETRSEETGSVETGSVETGSVETGFEETGFEETGSVETGSKEKGTVEKWSEEKDSVDKQTVEKRSEEKRCEEKRSEEKGAEEKGSLEKGLEDNKTVEQVFENKGSLEEKGIVEKRSVEKKSLENKTENELTEKDCEEKKETQERPFSAESQGTSIVKKYSPTKKKELKNKVSQSIGCQVSTLSKRILDAPPNDLSQTLTKIPSLVLKPSQSKTTSIKPPSASSQKRASPITMFRKSKSFLNKNSSEATSPRDYNSYLNIHLNKLEREKAIDKKIGIDKFGLVSSRISTHSDDSKIDISNFFNPYESDENIPKRKFEDIAFKF